MQCYACENLQDLDLNIKNTLKILVCLWGTGSFVAPNISYSALEGVPTEEGRIPEGVFAPDTSSFDDAQADIKLLPDSSLEDDLSMEEEETSPSREPQGAATQTKPAPKVKTEIIVEPPIGSEEKGYLSQLFSGSKWPDLSVSGYLKNETAYRLREPRSLTKIRNIFYLNAGYEITSDIKLNFSGWAYHDLVYDLYDYQTIAARLEREAKEPLVFIANLPEEKDSPVAEVRELYLDLFFENVDIRLGKQYIIWGVLEGNRVTDEMNPLDFRELFLPELLDYRVPLWSAKVDYYRDEADYQLLFIPQLKFHQPAPQGSEWELLQEVPNTTFPESYKLSNTEFALKATTDQFLETEITLSYFYTWDDYPVLFRRLKVNLDPAPTFFPTYTRISIFGATFIKPVNEYIIKGEFAYVPDKYFGISNDTDGDGDGFLDQNGVFKKAHIRWGLGVDFNYNGMDVSPAIVQWIIMGYDKPIIQDEIDTSLSLYLRKDLHKINAIFELLAIYSINFKDAYLQPKIAFRITDNFQITGGLDLFSGENSQFGVGIGGNSQTGNLVIVEERARFFGNFDDNDRIFVEFKYAF